jgi:hypothetical protein
MLGVRYGIRDGDVMVFVIQMVEDAETQVHLPIHQLHRCH